MRRLLTNDLMASKEGTPLSSDNAKADIPKPVMLVNGELIAAGNGGTLESINPATEEVIGLVPNATVQDVSLAVDSAADASTAWAGLAWQQRAAALRELAAVVRSNAEELAILDAMDSGNPVTSMRRDVETAADDIDYFAGIAGELKGQTIPSGTGAYTLTEFVPYTVVGRIVPFNHPLKFAAAKSAAPLAAGCAVIVKPGEQTSLSAMRLGELAREIFPPGVFNVLTGDGSGAGAGLASHPKVPRLAFTGSVRSGQAVAALGVESMKHVTLELGGKNPFVVFPDVSIEAAADGAVKAMNIARSMGQSCGSTSRVLVHRSIYDEFVKNLVVSTQALRIGDPLDPKTHVGPLAFRTHYERVLGYIASGVEEGAVVASGGGRPSGFDRGFYVEPTIFTDVSPEMKIAREEIFGPVMSVVAWDDEDDMVALANATEYGLTANIWTNDISAALRTARRVEAGYVSVNGTGARPTGAAFGGVKNSGYGKEGSMEELFSYGRFKSITVTLR